MWSWATRPGSIFLLEVSQSRDPIADNQALFESSRCRAAITPSPINRLANIAMQMLACAVSWNTARPKGDDEKCSVLAMGPPPPYGLLRGSIRPSGCPTFGSGSFSFQPAGMPSRSPKGDGWWSRGESN
jgi:hypothetical protein